MTRDEFWQTYRKTDTCWDWMGTPNNSGYGSATIDGRSEGAHRHAYREQIYGPMHPNLHVLHHCDNRLCGRLGHLFQGTQSDNMKDMISKGRSRAYRFPSGPLHPNFGKPMRDDLKAAMSERKKRPFRVIDPSGTLIEGINLTEFCKANGLNQGAMWLVITGSGGRLSHKGYTKAP